MPNARQREYRPVSLLAYATDLVIDGNQIADTRTAGRTQRYGIYKAPGAGSVEAKNNSMSGHSGGDFHDAGLRADAR